MYYSLLCAAGLVRRGVTAEERPLRGGVSAPVHWALVVAGLCQFAGPRRSEHASDGGARRTATLSGEARWDVVERILKHVSAVNARDGACGSFYGTVSEDAASEAQALAALRTVLSYSDGPLDGLSECRLRKLLLRCCCTPGDDDASVPEASAEAIAAVKKSEAEAEHLLLAQLFLRLAQDTAFLRSSATWPPSPPPSQASQLAQYARTVFSDVKLPDMQPGTATGEDAWSSSEAASTAVGESLRLYLDGTVLPLVLTVLRALRFGDTNGNNSTNTRNAVTALMTRLMHTRAELSAADGETVPRVLLTETHIDSLVDWFTPHDTAAEAQELLNLYKENAMYREHIRTLLESIEGK